LSLAFGDSQWHGDLIDKGAGDPCVLYLAAEGSFGFRNRVRAWRSARNIAPDAKDTFVMIERSIDFMNVSDVDKLIRTVRRAIQRRPCLVVVDTVSRSMPGADENLQKEMTLFVKACDHVKDVFQCAVLGVHHAGKSGDMRGSTVLRGAGDFVFKLERAKGASIGHLTCEKQKDAPDGWAEPYVFERVDLDEGQTSLVASRAAIPGGMCEFDLPAYHYWLHKPADARESQLKRWLAPFASIRAAVDIVLRLLRDSGRPEFHHANSGSYQRMLESRNPQLIRVSLADDLPCVPEISANKYMLNIRFVQAGPSAIRSCTAQPLDFELTFCNL
jgi:hypothetical protein